jgi:hypothetical protein
MIQIECCSAEPQLDTRLARNVAIRACSSHRKLQRGFRNRTLKIVNIFLIAEGHVEEHVEVLIIPVLPAEAIYWGPLLGSRFGEQSKLTLRLPRRYREYLHQSLD